MPTEWEIGGMAFYLCFKKLLKKAGLPFLPKGAIDNIIFYGSTPGETKNNIVFLVSNYDYFERKITPVFLY